jgi:hypothetical protein
VVVNGHVVTPGLPIRKERVRELKSQACGLFNKRRGQLCAARRRVDAARIALGLPTLAAVADRQAVAADLQASKTRQRHPIASAPAVAG